MRTLISILVSALALVACDSNDMRSTMSAPVTSSIVATTTNPPSDSTATTGESDTGESTTAAQPQTDDEPAEPSYDVYLAAVAEAVSETRFANVPFEQPELTVATGLALCEAIAADEATDAVVVDFLTELTDGDPSTADEGQLILSGALLGAAEAALCVDRR